MIPHEVQLETIKKIIKSNINSIDRIDLMKHLLFNKVIIFDLLSTQAKSLKDDIDDLKKLYKDDTSV